MDEEIFVDIKGYEGLYQISNYGRVYSINYKYILRTYETTDNSKKYVAVKLYKNKKSKAYYIHRLVLSHFNRDPNNKEEGRHIDGDTRNNKLRNLEWGTHKENEEDKLRHGTNAVGSRNGLSKLTEQQVIEIRELYKTRQYKQRDLARMFNISFQVMSAILNYKAWKHI